MINIDLKHPFSEDFWHNMQEQIACGSLKSELLEDAQNLLIGRVANAMNQVPLPEAFRKGSITLRQLIKIKRKHKLPFDQELMLLYWLAAIQSLAQDYSELCHCPGNNVLESIPPSVIHSLTFDYNTIGYNNLTLLNENDIARFIACWGEPVKHSTLNQLYHPLWKQYEQKYKKNNPFLRELKTKKPTKITIKKYPKGSKFNNYSTLFFIIVVLFVLGRLAVR